MNETIKDHDAIKSLQAFCLKELEMGVSELNGENNSKHVKDKHTWEYKYTSTARTVTRNLWLMDFIYHLMDNLTKDATTELNTAVK